MIWNNEFLTASSGVFDDISDTTNLSDILFQEDLLQELKTSNINLTKYLLKPEIITQLIDNITQLTELDCFDKLLYSRVHVAYVSCEILTVGSSEILNALIENPNSFNKILSCLVLQETPLDKIRIVPQKATLISKLISAIHSQAPADLSCYITKNIESFERLIQVLINNVDVSGSFEILSTFINRTNPPELRYVFCEILNKFDFVLSLVNVMTLSNVEDKQRNACQLLCDVILIGRQETTEQNANGPVAQDMSADLMVSREAVHLMFEKMFSSKEEHGESKELSNNTTAIICGIKLLRTLVEQKVNNNQEQNNINPVSSTVEQIQDEIAQNLINIHEILLNPPKQEPIKTTFGVIQKPLGYIRLEVVNLIRALLSTFSPVIIKKLVELKTMKVIIDLFVEYPWNNLLHTQVEQAVTYIIRNCRRDEDSIYQVDMQKDGTNHAKEDSDQLQPSLALLSQLLDECDLIGKILSPKESGEQANFGHIIQIINSLSISCDLDTIKNHLNKMKDERHELHARWTTFVNVDVASFKEISLYCDVQSVNNYAATMQKHNQPSDNHNMYPMAYSNQDNNFKSNGDDKLTAYFSYLSFTKENVIPTINVDVLSKARGYKSSNY